jgi:flagellar motor switch protein FliG
MADDPDATFRDREPKLSSAQKVATILFAMGNEPAARVLKHFDPEDLKAVTRAAAQLGPVRRSTVESIIGEFEQDFASAAALTGDVGNARALIQGAVPPDQVASIISDALNTAGMNVFERIAGRSEAALAAVLKLERPATAAYVLSKFESRFASGVLAGLPRDLRNATFIRLMSPINISELAAGAVAAALRVQLLDAPPETSPAAQQARMASIINSLDPADADDAMKTLMQAHPIGAAELRKLLFSFNDLIRLSQRARSLVFDKVATEVVVLALRGTEADFRDAVLSSMSPRARRLVEGELKAPTNAQAAEIAKARKSIAATVLEMSKRNEIEITLRDAVEIAVDNDSGEFS